jgi:HK97 family phage portal protein
MTLIQRLKAAFTKAAFTDDVPPKFTSASGMTFLGRDVKRPDFSHQAAVRYCSSWVYAAARLNAIAVASQPLRLYVRSRGAGAKLWNTRRTDRRTKAYLSGDLAQLPSRFAMSKAAEFGDDYEAVTDRHPLLDLLARVNPYQNGFDATVLRVLYLELTGNAYVHPVIDRRLGVPAELWTMPSQWTEIVPGEGARGEPFIKGYRYGPTDPQKVDFAPDEVIHFKYPNPRDMYYGLGKVEAAWGAVTSNEALHEMDYFFFKNKSRPDYLAVIKGNASEAELDRFTAEVENKVRGTQRTGKFLAVTGDVDLKPLSFPPKDLEGREEIVEEIAAIFGVPVSMLRANDPNLASATVGFASWKETTILPACRMDEEVLNQSLLPLFGIEDDAFLAYDNPVKRDEVQESGKRLSYVQGGILTANEARQQEGLEPSDDRNADRLMVNGQPIGGVPTPIASPIAPARPVAGPSSAQQPVPAGEAIADTALNGAQISSLVDLAKSIQLGELPKDSAVSIASAAFPTISPETIASIFNPIQQGASAVPPQAPTSGEQIGAKSVERKDALCGCGCAKSKRVSHKALWEGSVSDRIQTKSAESEGRKINQSEEDMVRGVSQVFDKQMKDLLDALAKSERPTDELIAQAERLLRSRNYQRAMVDALAPYLREAIQTGVTIGIDTVAKVATNVDFDLEREDLAKYAETESIRLARQTAQGVTETTSVKVREVLGTGLENGETVDELADRVQTWAEGQKDQDGSWNRARTVARTEAARAARSAEIEAWQSTGMVTGKTWLLAPDPCEFCEAAAKQYGNRPVPVDQPFFQKGDLLFGVPDAEGKNKEMLLDFEDVSGPPLHPNCRCSMQPAFDAEMEQIARDIEASPIAEETRRALNREAGIE